MSAPESILVLGSGELGREVVKSLICHEHKGKTRLALLLRPSAIASRKKRAEIEVYEGMGVKIVPGDVVDDSSEQLSSIFASYHTIISCTGMTFPKGTQMKIARVVLEAGVQRYFPWQFGIDYDKIGRDSAQDLFDEQLDVRDLLRSQQKTKWVIVSTGMFISFLFEPSFGVVDMKKGSVTAIGSWENALTVTSPEDIGTVTAEIALMAPEEQGVVYVAGDTVTMTRLAEIVESLLGKKVERHLKTTSQLEAELAESSDDVMRKYRAVFGAGVGVSWDKSESFNGRRGIRTLSVEQWAQENNLKSSHT